MCEVWMSRGGVEKAWLGCTGLWETCCSGALSRSLSGRYEDSHIPMSFNLGFLCGISW